ncbi:MAG: hypothetical protein HRT94_02850 [Alphaproteobacteria bacterium]|nr:hypothetical protein [Alphaproteobacteria bacterium]
MAESKININEKIEQLKAFAATTNGLITLTVGFVVIVGCMFFIQSMMPKKGNIIYGLCGSFLEQQMTFPHTIEHTYVEMYRRAVRIYYKNFDAYGQQNFSYIECSFVQHPQKGVQMDNVIFKSPVKDITEKYYDDERKRSFYRVKLHKIDLFNTSGSPRAIMAGDPDLTLPEPKAMF